MLKRVFAILLAMVLIPVVVAAVAEETGQSCNAEMVKLTGENVELLAAAGGGEADEKFGKLYALKVEKAEDDNGNCLDDALRGRLLCYVPTKVAAVLLSGELKGKVAVTGRLIGGTVLMVESAAADTAEKEENTETSDIDEWEEIGVKTLSQQQVI